MWLKAYVIRAKSWLSKSYNLHWILWKRYFELYSWIPFSKIFPIALVNLAIYVLNCTIVKTLWSLKNLVTILYKIVNNGMEWSFSLFIYLFLSLILFGSPLRPNYTSLTSKSIIKSLTLFCLLVKKRANWMCSLLVRHLSFVRRLPKARNSISKRRNDN